MKSEDGKALTSKTRGAAFVAAFAAAWSALLSLTSFAALAAGPCDHCHGAREPVHVHLVSADNEELTFGNVMYFQGSGEKLRDAYHKKACPECKLVQYIGLKAESFKSVVEQAAASCQQIKLLTVVSHGNRGFVAIGTTQDKGGVTSSSLIDSLPASLSCAMAPDATIYFDGCNIARGCRGESFVTILAGRLLAKGGTIHACNTYNHASGFFPTYCPDLHSLSVDSGLKNARWSGVAPKTGADCKANVTSDLEALKRLVAEKGACNPDAVKVAGWANDWLAGSPALEDKLGDNRTQFTSEQETEARKLEVGYNNLDVALKALKKAPACEAGSRTCGRSTVTRVEDNLEVLWEKLKSKI